VMQSEWIQRVGSSVPRGFSRHFILETLKKKPLTGKEIIDFAVKQSDGKWKPSSIYNKYGKTYIKASKSSMFNSKLFIINKNKNQPISYQYKNGYIIVNAIIQNAILIEDSFFKNTIKIRRNK